MKPHNPRGVDTFHSRFNNSSGVPPVNFLFAQRAGTVANLERSGRVKLLPA